MADEEHQDRRQISLRLPEDLISRIDALKGELGCRSRGAIVERLLHTLLDAAPDAEPDPDSDVVRRGSNPPAPEHEPEIGSSMDSLIPAAPSTASTPASAVTAEARSGGDHEALATRNGRAASAAAGSIKAPTERGPDESQEDADSDFDESGALVLVAGASLGQLALDPTSEAARRRPTDDLTEPSDPVGQRRGGARGIDLPGFVQRRTDQLRRSLHPNPAELRSRLEPLPSVPASLLASALGRAEQHWHELYGQPPNETVVEAAMLWIAQDVWPQSDQSEGRPFTWSLASDLMRLVAPDWPAGPASFERVMVMAGILEDPFSCSTLELRLPTLIRRFVHRFRRRRSGSSFQTLEHTMTLHGALKLLQLPTDPGQRLTLPQIREAYREMALAHHPDAGGSEESMRRLNEAYQLLKELYRTRR